MAIDYIHAPSTPISLFERMCTDKSSDERCRTFDRFWKHFEICKIVHAGIRRYHEVADLCDLSQDVYLSLREKVRKQKITVPQHGTRIGWICNIIWYTTGACAKKYMKNLKPSPRAEEQGEGSQSSCINRYLLLLDDERQRAVIQMRYQEGMTLEAIGEELTLSTATVHRDHAQACDLLRDWLILLGNMGVIRSPEAGFSTKL